MTIPIVLSDPSSIADLKPGSEVLLPVKNAGTAPALLAENTVITTALNMADPSTPPNQLEIIFIRSGARLVGQTGRVSEKTTDGASLEMGGFQVVPELEESGRVRISIDSGVNMAVGILVHAVTSGLMDREVVEARFQDRLSSDAGQATSQ